MPIINNEQDLNNTTESHSNEDKGISSLPKIRPHASFEELLQATLLFKSAYKDVIRLDDEQTQYLETILNHEVFDSSILARLIDSQFPAVTCATLRSPSIPYAQLIRIVNLVMTGADSQYLLALSQNPNLSAPQLILLIAYSDKAIRNYGDYIQFLVNVARHPHIPSDAVEHLVTHDVLSVREALASNPSLSKEAFLILAQDDNVLIVQTLAENHSIPDEVKEQLSLHDDWMVKVHLAHQPTLPIDVIERLSNDEVWAVRSALASHPDLSLSAMRAMVVDEEPTVRNAVAKHPYLPVELIQQLAQDPDEKIRSTILYREDVPQYIINVLQNDQSYYVQLALNAIRKKNAQKL